MSWHLQDVPYLSLNPTCASAQATMPGKTCKTMATGLQLTVPEGECLSHVLVTEILIPERFILAYSLEVLAPAQQASRWIQHGREAK